MVAHSPMQFKVETDYKCSSNPLVCIHSFARIQHQRRTPGGACSVNDSLQIGQRSQVGTSPQDNNNCGRSTERQIAVRLRTYCGMVVNGNLDCLPLRSFLSSVGP